MIYIDVIFTNILNFQGLLDKVKLAYADATKTEIDLKIHPKKSLPSSSAGGIDLCNAKESIIVSSISKSYFMKS